MRGYGLQVGYCFHPENYGVSFLAYLSHQVLPGKDKPEQTTYDMAANLVGVDLIYKINSTPLSVFTGPSVHSWRVTQRGPGSISADQVDQHWKPGWRLGLGYRISKGWSVSTAFTQTAWRSRTDQDYVQGLNPSRPAYWSFLANFRF
jgi:hypothetical protein